MAASAFAAPAAASVSVDPAVGSVSERQATTRRCRQPLAARRSSSSRRRLGILRHRRSELSGDFGGIVEDGDRRRAAPLHRQQFGEPDVARVRVAVEPQGALGEDLGQWQVAGIFGLHRQQIEKADEL